MKKCMIVFVFLIFLGCQSIQPDQSTASSTLEGALPETSDNEETTFLATLAIPQKANVNEEFAIKAELKKETEEQMTISSRGQIFIIVIRDSTGKQINSFGITDMAKNREITGKTVITESYKYKIKEPGIYEISGVAEFTVIKDGKSENFMIETAPKKLEVVE